MAIAFDAYTDFSGTGTSLTQAHTCGGSNIILWVGVRSLGADPSGITYAGVSMTKLLNGTQGQFGSLWYLLAPTGGTNNVVISFSISDTASGSIASYSGVKQSASFDGSISDFAQTGTTASKALTTVADNCWLAAFVIENGAGVTSAGANTVIRGTGTTSYRLFEYSSNPKTPAGSQTLNFNDSGSASWGIMMVSFAPFVAPNLPFRSLIGVGI